MAVEDIRAGSAVILSAAPSLEALNGEMICPAPQDADQIIVLVVFVEEAVEQFASHQHVVASPATMRSEPVPPISRSPPLPPLS